MGLTKFNHKYRYITFKLADNLMGINILDIREILPCKKITKLHQAPAFVLGLMNLRGQILTVLDIGIFLGFEKRRINSKTHIIIFKHKDVGFMVDQIGDMIGADENQIESVPANMKPGVQKFMENIINLPKDVLMILNAKKVLSHSLTNEEMTKESL